MGEGGYKQQISFDFGLDHKILEMPKLNNKVPAMLSSQNLSGNNILKINLY